MRNLIASKHRLSTRTATLGLITLLIAQLNCCLVLATEDAAEGEQPQAPGEGENMDTVTEAPGQSGPQPADDADVTFMFTRPVVDKPYEFPIGKEVHFLVGFKNKGQKDFVLNTLDASFRYSADFSYTLQNFSSYPYNRLVEPNQETTLGYTFFISEQYAARSYGFTVNLLYSDKNDVRYQNTVFNETVTLIEIEEGFSGESFFLYIILAGFVALIAYGLNKLYIKYVNPTRKTSSKPVEPTKTANAREVDYDWLPPSMVANLKKTSSSNAAKKNPAPVAN